MSGEIVEKSGYLVCTHLLSILIDEDEVPWTLVVADAQDILLYDRGFVTLRGRMRLPDYRFEAAEILDVE